MSAHFALVVPVVQGTEEFLTHCAYLTREGYPLGD